MKILYVTGMADPIKDLLRGKKDDEITHAFQFFKPWHMLVQRGHQVDFVVASNFNEQIDIKVDWFSERNIFANIYDPPSELPWYLRVFRRIRRFIKLVYYTNKAIRTNKYDFIYCKAFYEGFAGNILANYYGIPCGMRAMGTTLNLDFDKYGVFLTSLKHPIEYITFKLKKDFFLMTDDGTGGDKVYNYWKPNKKKYDYLFWKTGIEFKELADLAVTVKIPSHSYLFFAARIEDWKRHDRVLKVLRILHDRGTRLHLYFAGSNQFKGYFENLSKMVEDLKLTEFVHFMGAIKQDDLRFMAYHAVANPFMYDISNLSNVFCEIFSLGAITIGINDGTLDEYIENGKTGFIANNENEVADIVEKILSGQYETQSIRNQAISCSREKMLGSDVRFKKEVELIERHDPQRR